MINYLQERAWYWSKPVKWWLTRDGLRYIYAQEFLGNYTAWYGVMDDYGSFVYV